METKRIKITVQERETKDENGKSRKFNTYKTVSKNGRYMDVKFRKECKNLPTENCYAIICTDDMNIDTNRPYPVLWVNDVQGYESIADVSSEQNKAKIDNFFD